jgi:broad specificity phosphatase PhoE
MTDILLLRHGQSEWNALGRWQGQADPPLSELGRRQAHHAAPRLPDVSAVFSSDLERAVATATIVADHHGLDVVAEPALRERHAGAWQGLTRVEIEDRWPGWLDERRRPDDYESDESVLARVRPALERIHRASSATNARRVVAVCHGGVVFTLERLLGAPFERLPNLAGRWLTVDDGFELELGERVTLVSGDEVTTPKQL